MPTDPPEHILDRDLSKALIRGPIDLAIPMLKEIVNHGVAAFARCSKTAKGEDENTAILFPYLRLLEMIDGVQILLAEAATFPARLQLRSAFESLLTIEYITETDTIRRAYAYLVADVRDRLASYHRMHPRTPEGKQMRKRIAADAYAGKMQIPDIPNLDARIKNLEALLKKPRWREADAEFRALQGKLDRRPNWHHLCDGPESVERLAEHLKRGGQYDIVYRPWSKTAHGVDAVKSKLAKGARGEPAIRRLRDPAEFETIVSFAANFGLQATRRIVLFYRPEEETSLARWYVREVREVYMNFIS